MRQALQMLSNVGVMLNGRRVHSTACQDRPVPFTEIRQTPTEAAKLCGAGTPEECPLLALCAPLGFTESIYADDMVYGGLSWRRGLPILSQEGYDAKRGKGELKKIYLETITERTDSGHVSG